MRYSVISHRGLRFDPVAQPDKRRCSHRDALTARSREPTRHRRHHPRALGGAHREPSARSLKRPNHRARAADLSASMRRPCGLSAARNSSDRPRRVDLKFIRRLETGCGAASSGTEMDYDACRFTCRYWHIASWSCDCIQSSEKPARYSSKSAAPQPMIRAHSRALRSFQAPAVIRRTA